MWIAKISMKDENDPITSRVKKFNVTVLGYLLSRFKKGNVVYLSGAGLLIGSEENKKAFVKDMKRDKTIKKIELNGDYFITLRAIEGLKSVEETIVDPSLIYPKPITILPSGEEIWEFASWDRSILMKKVNLAKKRYNAKLLRIENKKLGTLAILNVVPELTSKQKKAIEIAMKHGYYDYPRTAGLRKLAKIMGISFSTYQAHLRKAEARLLSYTLKLS